MSSRKRPSKQATLFKTGFTKTVKLFNDTVDVTDQCAKFVTSDPTLIVKCGMCPLKFKTTQALRSHETWAHKIQQQNGQIKNLF